MKSIEDILSEIKEKAYLWEDNETIDVEVTDEEKSFVKELIDFKCLKCETNVIVGNENVFDKFDDNVKGARIQCKTCEQKWFIHRPVVI